MKRFLITTICIMLLVSIAFAEYDPNKIYIDDVYDFVDRLDSEDPANGEFLSVGETGYQIFCPEQTFKFIESAAINGEQLVGDYIMAYSQYPDRYLEIETGFTEASFEEEVLFLRGDCMADIISSVYLLIANGYPAMFYEYDDHCGNRYYIMNYYIADHEYIKFTLHYFDDDEYLCYGCQIMYSLTLK